jgi:hypothetical protein
MSAFTCTLFVALSQHWSCKRNRFSHLHFLLIPDSRKRVSHNVESFPKACRHKLRCSAIRNVQLLIRRHEALFVTAADNFTALWNTECVIPRNPNTQAVSYHLHTGRRDVCVYINIHFIIPYQNYPLNCVCEFSPPFCFADQHLVLISYALIRVTHFPWFDSLVISGDE